MKKLITVWLVLIATLAIGATSASADEFTSESYPVVATGAMDQGFSDQVLMTWGTASCPNPTYTATVTGPSTSVSVTPNYGLCSMSGLPVTVDMNGCTYQFNIKGGAATTGDIDLVCPAGQEVTVTLTSGGVAKCTIHFKPQNDIGGTVTYSNIGAGTTREITVVSELTGIDYAHTKGTGLGTCTTGSGTSGSMYAKAVVTGEAHNGTHVGIFVSGA